MKLFIRLYNSDGPILRRALANGARVDGVVVDAHMLKLAADAMRDTRGELPSGTEVLVDPVTHKIRRPFFRKKATSFGRLSYYFVGELGTGAPKYAQLAERTDRAVAGMTKLGQTFGSTASVSPYLLIQPADFSRTGGAVVLGRRWCAAFRKAAPKGHAFVLSLCISADCLTSPPALLALESLLRDERPDTVYLLLYDFELGVNPTMDTAACGFLETLRSAGVTRIIYSHAPAWVYFLAPHGVTDFVSGMNYLATLKREYLDREDEIGGITHNYYIARRFCRMTPEQAAEATRLGILDRCSCPSCRQGIPEAQNAIREHYVHARAAECADLARARDKRVLLKRWGAQTEEFLERVRTNGLKVTGDPKPTQWLRAIE